MIPCSERLEHVHYDIRGPLYQAALAMEARGVEALKLNAGNPACFGFSLPQSLRQALPEPSRLEQAMQSLAAFLERHRIC